MQRAKHYDTDTVQEDYNLQKEYNDAWECRDFWKEKLHSYQDSQEIMGHLQSNQTIK